MDHSKDGCIVVAQTKTRIFQQCPAELMRVPIASVTTIGRDAVAEVPTTLEQDQKECYPIRQCTTPPPADTGPP